MSENLIFLPGLLCDSRLWRDQLAIFPEATVADLSLDDDVNAMAQRALASVEGRFALCGLSMGGYVALAIMHAAPERVTRLCLMDTSARADTPQQSKRRRLLMQMSQANAFRGVTPRLLPQLLHPDNLDQPVAKDVMEMAERVGREAFLRQQHAILNRPDRRGELGSIRIPTLIAVGSDDILTPPELAAEMAGLIAGAELRVIAHCGHLPPMERPDDVNDMLRYWLGHTGSA